MSLRNQATNRTRGLRLLLILIALVATFSRTTFAEGLPAPTSGGKAGGPISILFILQSLTANPKLDETVAAGLREKGYVFQTASDREPLTAEYLRQFNTVVLGGLDDYIGGGYYGPSGLSLLNTASNTRLLQDYVVQGGGLVVVPIMGEAGSQVATVFDNLLAPWKARLGWENVRDTTTPVKDHLQPDKTVGYSWTRNIPAGPLTAMMLGRVGVSSTWVIR